MHLVQVDVIGLEPLQAGLDPPHDVHAGGPAPVEVVAHGKADLRGQDDLLPHALQRVAQERLALTLAVDVRGVDEVDALVQRQLHHLGGGLLAEVAHVHLAAELHASQRHLAHDDACISEFPVFHACAPFYRPLICGEY